MLTTTRRYLNFYVACLAGCHFIGDFAFQSTWMSIEEGESWEVNFYHCATYTATFVLFAHPSLWRRLYYSALISSSDPMKSRYKVIGSIGSINCSTF